MNSPFIHDDFLKKIRLGLQVSKDQTMADLSTTNAVISHNICDQLQILSFVKPVNAHSNPCFIQLSRKPVDNLVADPVTILG